MECTCNEGACKKHLGGYGLFSKTQMTELNNVFGCPVPICPDCAEHTQADANECHDCKNLYWEEGRFYKDEKGKEWKSLGQCCCYSEAHGKR